MLDKCENQQKPEWERVEEKGQTAAGPDHVKIIRYVYKTFRFFSWYGKQGKKIIFLNSVAKGKKLVRKH